MARSISSANKWVGITPHDVTNIPSGTPSGLVCAVGGTVALVDQFGTVMTRTFAAEVIYPYMPLRINATGTTATGIMGLYN